MTQREDGWMERYTKTVAAEVRRHRERRGMSAQELADACAKLGAPIQRSVIANLENGRRASVSVAEVLVFAAVLEVPPGVLISPVGRTPDLEYLPGEKDDPYVILQWVAGMARRESGGYAWNPIPMYEELTSMLGEVEEARETVNSLVEITETLRQRRESLNDKQQRLEREFDRLGREGDELSERLSNEDSDISAAALKDSRKILDRMKQVNAEMKQTAQEVHEVGQPFRNLEHFRMVLSEAEEDVRRQVSRIREQGLLPPRFPDHLAYLLDVAPPRKAKRSRRTE